MHRVSKNFGSILASWHLGIFDFSARPLGVLALLGINLSSLADSAFNVDVNSMVHVHPEQGVVISIGASMIFDDAHLNKLGRVPIVRIEALPSPTIRSARTLFLPRETPFPHTISQNQPESARISREISPRPWKNLLDNLLDKFSTTWMRRPKNPSNFLSQPLVWHPYS
jgi:hypothetical protein